MDEKQTQKVLDEIEAWWQERRTTCAMDTETHNAEQTRVEDLKKRIRALAPEGETGKAKK